MATSDGNTDGIHKRIGIGLFAGAVQAVLFHPYDRALFLCQVNGRPFLDVRNFPFDFKGLDVNVIQRSLTYGLFFPLEALFCSELRRSGLPGTIVPLLGGQLAGATNGFLANGLSLVKYHRWRHPGKTTRSLEIVRNLHNQFGYRVLSRGLIATVMRDSIFGACFTFLRTRKEQTIWRDGGAAFVATCLSSPLNYARNMQYACPDQNLRVGTTLVALWNRVLLEKGIFARMQKLVSTLCIGYGTVRVAVGMSVGGALYRIIDERV